MRPNVSEPSQRKFKANEDVTVRKWGSLHKGFVVDLVEPEVIARYPAIYGNMPSGPVYFVFFGEYPDDTIMAIPECEIESRTISE